MHGVLWDRLNGEHYEVPEDRPLTLAACRAAGAVTCYVEPLAVGQHLPPMPLFLDPAHYVNAPLAPSDEGAYLGLPRHVHRVLQA